MGLFNRTALKLLKFSDRLNARVIEAHKRQIMKSQVAILKTELKRDEVRAMIAEIEAEEEFENRA